MDIHPCIESVTALDINPITKEADPFLIGHSMPNYNYLSEHDCSKYGNMHAIDVAETLKEEEVSNVPDYSFGSKPELKNLKNSVSCQASCFSVRAAHFVPLCLFLSSIRDPGFCPNNHLLGDFCMQVGKSDFMSSSGRRDQGVRGRQLPFYMYWVRYWLIFELNI